VQIHATEDNTAVGRCRTQPHGNANAAVQTDASTVYVSPQGFLRPVHRTPELAMVSAVKHFKQNQCQFSGFNQKAFRRGSLAQCRRLVEPPDVLDLGVISAAQCLFFTTGDQ
jgi:hypothetical protein